MLNKTASAAAMVTLAEADLVGSATLVAFTVTVAGEGTLAGGTYSPLTEIVPHATSVHPAPLTVQVKAVFEVPVTFPTNC
jgi:N-methylhydantoinase B/oxoprolinase/acetone carboxylase alpha subunit